MGQMQMIRSPMTVSRSTGPPRPTRSRCRLPVAPGRLQRALGNRAIGRLLGHVGARAPVLQRYRVEDCDPHDNPLQYPQTVHVAHGAAVAMLTTAIQKSGTPTDPAVQNAANRWFKISLPPADARSTKLWDHVTRALVTMKDADPKAVYECEPRQSWWHGGCVSGNVAVSLWNIHLCPLWWTSFHKVTDRAAILLHEWGHKWGKGVNRIFETYCEEKKFATLSAEQRVQLPDAYSGFIYELTTGTRPSWCPI